MTLGLSHATHHRASTDARPPSIPRSPARAWLAGKIVAMPGEWWVGRKILEIKKDTVIMHVYLSEHHLGIQSALGIHRIQYDNHACNSHYHNE